jgi:hypothetical protein
MHNMADKQVRKVPAMTDSWFLRRNHVQPCKGSGKKRPADRARYMFLLKDARTRAEKLSRVPLGPWLAPWDIRAKNQSFAQKE